MRKLKNKVVKETARTAKKSKEMIEKVREKWNVPYFMFADKAEHFKIPKHSKRDEYQEVAWGIPEYGMKPELMVINRPKPKLPGQVKLEILYCGISHMDCHYGFNQFGNTKYPLVPGNEIVGKVVEIGDMVTKFKVGDYAAAGNIQDVCMYCENCNAGDEQYCTNGLTSMYNSKKWGVKRNMSAPYVFNYTEEAWK